MARVALAASVCIATVAAVAVIWSVQSSIAQDRRPVLFEVHGNVGGLPALSSVCVTGMEHCQIAVPGGSLRLSDIYFPTEEGAHGTAMAVGYVNGKFVSGRVQLAPKPGPEEVQRRLKNGMLLAQKKAKALKQRRAHKRTTVLTAESDQQYQLALQAVEKNMEERQQKVNEEAKRIAEAVTKEITSPEVSARIANLAMDAAAAKAFPTAEASQTGAVSGGEAGMGQNGYSNQPAGAQQPTQANGQSSLSADLETVPAAPSMAPASSAFYQAWKALGGPMGQVAAVAAPAKQTLTVKVQHQLLPAAPTTTMPAAPAPVSMWAPVHASALQHSAPSTTIAGGFPATASTTIRRQAMRHTGKDSKLESKLQALAREDAPAAANALPNPWAAFQQFATASR